MIEEIQEPRLISVSGRYVGLDFARSVFIVLGVIFHSAMVFITPQTYRVTSPEVGVGFDRLTTFIHDFRMYGFFLLSGFFYALLIERRGLRPALVDRNYRLFVPLIVVGFSLNSVMTLYSTNYRYAESLLGYLVGGEWLGHLWFIGNLAGYCLLFNPLAPQLLKVRHARLPAPPLSTLLILAVCLATPLGGLLFAAIGRPAPVLFIMPFEFLHYAPFFLAGLICYGRKDVFACLIQFRPSFVLLMVALAGQALIEATLSPDQALFKLIRPFETAYHLALALLIIGILQRAGRPSTIIQATVAAGYTIYLMHEPIIAVLAPQLVQLKWASAPTFAALAVITLGSSYAIHVLLVARSPFMRFLLNGVRPASMLASTSPATPAVAPESGRGQS